MQNHLSSQTIRQNLLDAGCHTKMIEQFLSYQQNGDLEHQLSLLSSHRQKLLDKVHFQEKQIDCLDYLVYQLQKDSHTSTPDQELHSSETRNGRRIP